jgi:hypothetical protein
VRKLLASAAKGLAAIIASAVVTALISGQPIPGLVRLRGLSLIFLRSSVPAWAFSVTLLGALWGMHYAYIHRRKREQLHFVPDAHNCFWGKAGQGGKDGKITPVMFVNFGGTLTYEGENPVTLVKGYFAGTSEVIQMIAQIMAGDFSRMVAAFPLQLNPHQPTMTVISLRLAPMVGQPGQTFRGRLILRDAYNKEHELPPVEFPFRGEE